MGLLLIVVVTLVLVNRGDAELRRALEENRQFQILVEGNIAVTVSLNDLIDMHPQEFITVMNTSANAPQEVSLKGVELRVLLDAFGIDAPPDASFIVSALDGYVSPLTRSEVYKEENAYICYSMDGEILKTWSDGGYGPFMMVLRSELFAQRWCKYVETIDVRR
jgi:hypothetical protein